MQDGATLVFVEVRLRRNPAFGGAAASIDTRKQAKLIRAAQHYLATQIPTPPCRFDVVLLGADATVIDWLKNAFDA